MMKTMNKTIRVLASPDIYVYICSLLSVENSQVNGVGVGGGGGIAHAVRFKSLKGTLGTL